jgi:putative ABC transport system permease protein
MRTFLASARRAPSAYAGIFVALLVAASLMTVVGRFGGTALQMQPREHRLAATAAVVVGDPVVSFTAGSGDDADTVTLPLPTYRRVPAALADDIDELPGVASAVADVSVPVTMGDDHLEATVHGWQSSLLAPFTLTAGVAPAGSGQIVLGDGLAETLGATVGSSVQLAGRANAAFVVSGIVAAPIGDPLADHTAFVSDAVATDLYGHDSDADLVAVVAEPGREREVADAVRDLVADDLVVRTGAGRSLAETVGLAGQRMDLGEIALGGGIPVAMIAMFVAAGAIGLSVAGRRRTFALLRAVGATPRQIRRQVYVELTVLGAVAGTAGYGIGTALTSAAMRGLGSHGLVPDGVSAWNAPWLLAASAGAAIVVGVTSGYVAARRASRSDPLLALRESEVERRPGVVRTVLGVTTLGGGIALLVLAVNESGDPVQQLQLSLSMLMTLVAGVALLGPVLVKVAAWMIRLPLQRLGPSARIALADIQRRPSVVASAVVSVAISVSFLGTVYLVNTNFTHAAETQGAERLVAATVVAAPGGLDDDAVTMVGALPSTGTTIGITPTTVFLPAGGGIDVPAVAVTPGRLSDVLDLGVVDGDLDTLDDGEIAVSQLDGGADVGDVIDTFLADGTPYRATVVATYRRGLGFGDAVIPVDAAGGDHLGDSPVAQILTTGEIADTEIDSLTATYPGINAGPTRAANGEAERMGEKDDFLNTVLVLTMAVFGVITLVNTLITATVGRRRTIALLDRVGATRRQLLAVAGWQTGAVAGIGVVCGVGTGLAALLAATKAVTGSWVPYVPAGPVIGVLLATVVLTAAAIVGPTIALTRRSA